jgi:hypothetical protein
MNWKKVLKAVLLGVTLTAFCTGLVFQEGWLRMYECGEESGVIERASGSSHDYYQRIGLTTMQRNVCKDGKSDPHEGDGLRYGGKTCSFSLSTLDVFHLASNSIRYKQEGGTDYTIHTGSETFCYKNDVEDTQNLADRFNRIGQGLLACALLIILNMFMLTGIIVGKVLRWRYFGGALSFIVVTLSSFLGLFVLILSASLPPGGKYTYCVSDKTQMLNYNFDNVFSLGWCWYIFMVGFLTLVAANALEALVAIENRRMRGTSGEASPLVE